LLPVNTTPYPVAIATAASSPAAEDIYETDAGSGEGSIVVGGAVANPVGWWINLASNVAAGTYTSTVTMQVIAGP
jgi:hypothetical protein